MAVAIRAPKDITLPIDPQKIGEALNALRPEDQHQFTQELVESLATAKSENDFRPFLEVILGWYFTVKAREDPENDRILHQERERAEHGGPIDVPTMTVDELRQEVDRIRKG